MNNYRILFILSALTLVSSGCSSVKLVQMEGNMNSAVTTIKTGQVNMYLIKASSGYILVDAGFPLNGKTAINKALSKAGISPEDIKLIIITHAHPDHVGALSYIREASSAPVICQKSGAYYLSNGICSPIVARNVLGRFLSFFTPGKIKAVNPDILFDEEFDLEEFGISGKVIHAPGHTEDSSVIVLENGEMLIGDLLRGEYPDINAGMFYENPDELIVSIEKLIKYHAETIYMSHSSSITGRELENIFSVLKEEMSGLK